MVNSDVRVFQRIQRTNGSMCYYTYTKQTPFEGGSNGMQRASGEEEVSTGRSMVQFDHDYVRIRDSPSMLVLGEQCGVAGV